MIRNTLAWLIVLLSLSACQGNKSYDQRMQQADSLMEQRALLASQAKKPLLAASKILDSLRHDSASFTLRQLMRYQLLRVKLHNKQNLSLAHDTIMTAVADYYRRHGSPNEQVEALYLMGRVYHDQGRLPQAIDLYQQADQAADTTRSDCNFWHLFLVHSQLSEIYAEQCLPDRNCEELEKMKRFAAKTNDTLSMLTCDVWRAEALWDCGKYDDAVSLENSACKKIAEAGYEQLANGCHAHQIYCLLEQGKAAEARVYMDLQEKKSGIFDSLGNIERGREHYYYSMGTYQLLVNHLDSAEFYYRKLLAYPDALGNLEAAYKGLLNLYIQKSINDSVGKYARLFCNANDSILKNMSTEKIQFIRSLYDYSRYQELANSKTREAKATRNIATIIVLTLVIALFTLVYLFNIYRSVANKKQEKQNEKYAETYRQYTRLVKEKEKLEQEQCANEEKRSSVEKEKADLESEIEHLKNIIANRQNDKLRPEKWNIESQILTCQEVVALHQFAAKGTAPGTLWSDLYNQLNLYLPRFVHSLNREEYRLTDLEKQVVVLTKLRFIGHEMHNLLGKSSQSITNIRANINKKMFGGRGVGGLDVAIYKLGEALETEDVKDVNTSETPCSSDVSHSSTGEHV